MISNDFSNTLQKKDGTQVRQGQARKWKYKQPLTDDEKYAKLNSRLQKAESQGRKIDNKMNALTAKIEKLESETKKFTSKKEGTNGSPKHSESQTEPTS